MPCELCEESETNHVIEIRLVVKHKNPQAYGYPEVVFWEEEFNITYKCPCCGRKLENLKRSD